MLLLLPVTRCQLFSSISLQTWASELSFSSVYMTTFMVQMVVRCPVSTFVSFAFKSRKENKSRVTSREKRLKKVLLHARQEREELQKRREELLRLPLGEEEEQEES